jgi:hypothetical protein
LTILQYNLWAIPAGRFLMSGGIFGWMIFVVNLKQAIGIPRRLTIKAVAVIHDPNLRD